MLKCVRECIMTFEERKVQVRSYLGKTVRIIIDRPIGYEHKKDNYSIVYPINYGYIPGVIGGDGEELDVYLLGVNEPVKEYAAKIIGIAHRENDNEDKLVAAPEGSVFIKQEIKEVISFQEKYFNTEIEALFEKSCGCVPYTMIDGTVHYLLIRSRNGDCGFPKGHVEKGESEIETAIRETFEETSVKVEIIHDFRRETRYTMRGGKEKTVVYFLAKYIGQTPEHNSGFEYSDYLVLPFEEAYDKLSFENTKLLLKEANNYLEKNIL